jgi:two-component system, NarL family, nitrate/nitrite response regulator NarL
VTRVLILAEFSVHREALAGSLGGDGRIDVEVAVDLEEALAALEEVRPQIVLVDMPMPAGANAVRALVSAAPQAKVVAVEVSSEAESDVIALAEAGAAGYVTREASTEDLVAAVEAASRGEVLCSPGIAGTLLRRVGTLARERRPEPIEGPLTARELDVLCLIEEGRSNKEIARALSIELPTVKNHVHSILEKLDVHRRTAAVAHARRLGLLRGGSHEPDDATEPISG